MVERYSDDLGTDREIKDAFIKSEGARQAHRDWLQKWALSLAVANGGALLALFTAMLGDKRPWELLPCGVFFLAGLVLAGTVPFSMAKAFYFEDAFYWSYGRRLIEDHSVSEGGKIYTAKDFAGEMKKRRIWWMNSASYLGVASGVLFSFGGALALGLMSLKLFRFI